MGTWKTRGLRGSGLEELLNVSNDIYKNAGIALIQKIPTPITPVNIEQESRHITLAYFAAKSTVDYIGVVQGIPVCFDAKECAEDTFPLQNIHEHQVKFMKDFEGQDGIAFLLIFFSSRHEFYYMTFREMMKFWTRWEDGGRRSFRITELDPRFFMEEKQHLLPILDGIQRDLSDREPDSAPESEALAFSGIGIRTDFVRS